MPTLREFYNAMRETYTDNSEITLADIDEVWSLAGFGDEEDDDDEPLPNSIVMNGVSFTHPDHVRFIIDMQDAGFDPYLYHGRFWYHGPACDSNRSVGITPDDIVRATSVKLNRDNMGLDMVLYPMVSDHTLTGVREEIEEDSEIAD